MIQDSQEYLQHWEKENNPFYPSEMRWDRLQAHPDNTTDSEFEGFVSLADEILNKVKS